MKNDDQNYAYLDAMTEQRFELGQFWAALLKASRLDEFVGWLAVKLEKLTT